MSRMTIQDYSDYVLKQLGHPYIKIENVDNIDEVIKDTLSDMKEYMSFSKFVTLTYMNRIDLSAYKVRNIIQAYRTEAADSITNSAGTTDAFLLALGMVQGVPYDLTRYAELLQIRQIKNTITTDLDWVWDDPYLYITQNAVKGALVTIEYVPDVTSVEEITDDYWIGKFKKLAVANEKIILGRIRSKLTATNSVYVNDGPTILQEGLNERNAIMNFLEQNSDIMLPIGS